MKHGECLKALDWFGASQEAINWTSPFLFDTTMSVKSRSARSEPWTVPGGSPQGSILGNFLFCATTDCFATLDSPQLSQVISDTSTDLSATPPETAVPIDHRILPYSDIANSTPTARGQFASFRPPACLLDLSGDFVSDEDDSFQFLNPRPFNPLDTTIEESPDHTQCIPRSVCRDPLQNYVYIDDYNTIEKQSLKEAEVHITTEKKKVRVLAGKSEAQFQTVQALAQEIKMRVNCKKTQVLCIHTDKYSQVNSYIRSDQEEICSSSTLKILGFLFRQFTNCSAPRYWDYRKILLQALVSPLFKAQRHAANGYLKDIQSCGPSGYWVLLCGLP